jgi:FlaA1/EpsC-like NDP-sugar epimerase
LFLPFDRNNILYCTIFGYIIIIITMKFLFSLSLLVCSAQAFTAVVPKTEVSSTALFAELDRRSAISTAAASLLAIGTTQFQFPSAALAEETSTMTVVVAGATGQSGRRILERLAGQKGLTVVGAVRNPDKAAASLSESSTVIRGAMVQTVGSIDTIGVALKHLDVVKDTPAEIKDMLAGADSLVIAVGFVPGNPLKMNQVAHEVDNLGTCKLIDAAKAAGVKKVVMISSILTNGRSWGQEKSAGFVITNAFGNVLDEKIVAENYLRASGLDYTIVRPGGLKAKPRK